MNNLNLSDFLDIIRKINNGSIIPNSPDSFTHISLGTSEVDLYRYFLPDGCKYFFFADLGATEDLDNAISEIESITIFEKEKWCHNIDPHPSDSYLICFWQVPQIDEFVNKQVINLEENEFYFKKYVFYYTKKEYVSFSKWFDKQPNSGYLVEQLQSKGTKKLSTSYMKFFTRLVIKVPCIATHFCEQRLPSFDDLVTDNLTGIQSDDTRAHALEMNQTLMDYFSHDKSHDDLVNAIVSSIEKECEV